MSAGHKPLTIWHPALWLTLLFSGAVIVFVASSQVWTATRIANAWRREISDADDERAIALLPRLAALHEAAVPHLVQLLDDDRETLRHATCQLLREKLNLWLRERSAVDQRCLACLAQEFAAQPLPRDAREREFVKQASLKLLRWPGEEACINTTQLLLDCTATLQHIAESRPLPMPPSNALAAANREQSDRAPTNLSLSDLTEDTPLADAEAPSEPATIVPNEPLPPRDPYDPEPFNLPTDGAERLVPPDRFVPEAPRRIRSTEMNLNDEEPTSEISPTSNQDERSVETTVVRKLETRALIRHLHGLAAIAQAAEVELRNRGFTDTTLAFARQLDDADPQVRLKLVEALPFATNLNSTAWLFELTNDPDTTVRTAARNILSTSRNPHTQRQLGNPPLRK